jgi:hypothetical protein
MILGRSLFSLRSSVILHNSRRTLLTQAFARGPNTPDLLECTIGEHFAGVVKEHGDRPAYVFTFQVYLFNSSAAG